MQKVNSKLSVILSGVVLSTCVVAPRNLLSDGAWTALKVDIESFGLEMRADFSMDARGKRNRQLGLALAVLFGGVVRTRTSD